MLRQLVLSSARGRCFAAPYLSDSHRVVLEALASVAHIDSAGLEQRAMAHAQTKDKAAIRRVLHHLRGNRAQRRITQEDIDDPRSDLDPLRRLGDRIATHQRVVGRFRNENAAEAGVFDFARKLNEVLVRNSRRRGDRNAETCHFDFLSRGFADKIRLRLHPGRAYLSAPRRAPANASCQKAHGWKGKSSTEAAATWNLGISALMGQAKVDSIKAEVRLRAGRRRRASRRRPR